jgi:hypothetical protein
MDFDTPITETLAFAKQQYSDRESIYGCSLVQHCVSVAKTAENIAVRLYQDLREDIVGPEAHENLVTIVHGAILHDVINVSRCAFEHIAERTTVQIAALVADLSRDYRLVETKRDMEFRGRLSQSPVSSQIVAVADAICTSKEICAMLKATGLTSVPRARKILMQLDGDLLAVHAASRFYTLRLYVHAARNLLQDASQMIKECKSQARTARLVSRATQEIRSKMAAKVTSEEKPKKEKEPKRGKKRTH